MHAPLAVDVHPLLDWGAPILRWFNGLPTWLGALFDAASFVGSIEILTVVAAVVLWSVSARVGWRVVVVLLVYGSLNTPMKVAFGLPRPYWVLPDITARAAEPSYGLPSGHSGFAAAVYGRLTVASAQRWDPRWVWAIGGTLIALIAASRMYLGVHWPSDVLAGLVAGAVVLLLALRLEPRLSAWFREARPWRDAALVAAAAVALLGTVVATAVLTSGQEVPAAWSQLAATAVPDGEPLDPRALDGPIGATGALFGFGLGWIVLRRQGGYDAAGSIAQRLGRLPIGLAGALLLFGGVGVEPTGRASAADLLLTWVQYAAAGGWMSWGAPALFIRTGLAARPSTDDGDDSRGWGQAGR